MNWKRVWFKALGEKASPCDKESDAVAWIRSVLIGQAFVTNFFIMAGIIRHWW